MFNRQQADWYLSARAKLYFGQACVIHFNNGVTTQPECVHGDGFNHGCKSAHTCPLRFDAWPTFFQNGDIRCCSTYIRDNRVFCA